ncbi:hypothetical protein [Lactobacillus equicursoris]|uniref:hypothetical protein n=1 Tax=Lactobacillus equicursoris TaxID=420645 RepID=UPI0005872C6F|nr:hypothetical protein [Lactobacillus equicursoris]
MDVKLDRDARMVHIAMDFTPCLSASPRPVSYCFETMGRSVCCMFFDVGTPHKSANRETFFDYCRNDGFNKRKNLGRVEQMDESGNSLWVANKEDS